ncbi:MAG TPA: hypothetical protein ENH85_14720 [Candidatus Scalindua sp.]|nr:hypothetical protein [Candidatus Scalindua sp.]
MNVYLLGAGASKAYSDSHSGLRMPIANDFFKTFNQSELSEDLWVLIGDVLNVAKKDFGYDYLEFLDFRKDIELFHSHIEQRLFSSSPDQKDWLLYYRAFNQLIFIFSSLINVIQSGPISQPHINLVRATSENDTFLTFNWDTLLDRALMKQTNWIMDSGYGFKPEKIYKDQWCLPDLSQNVITPKLIKLHGSTNWLTTYPVFDGKGGMKLNQVVPPETVYLYESTIHPYSCWKGRFKGPMEDTAYYYYPPNILDEIGIPPPDGYSSVRMNINMPGMPSSTAEEKGIPSIPLIIPPVKKKTYERFGSLFPELWRKAEDSLACADSIIVIGYSFPKTDVKTIELFKKSFIKRKTMPKVTILDPNPEEIVRLIEIEFGIRKDVIKVIKEYFDENFDTKRLLS